MNAPKTKWRTKNWGSKKNLIAKKPIIRLFVEELKYRKISWNKARNGHGKGYKLNRKINFLVKVWFKLVKSRKSAII